MKQVNLRLPENLKKLAEAYVKKHGYRNIQELAVQSIREKISENDRETIEVLSDHRLMKKLVEAMKSKHVPAEELAKRHGLKWHTK